MGKWQHLGFFIGIKSSEVGTLKRVSFQRSCALNTKASSELISNVNLSFCTQLAAHYLSNILAVLGAF